VSGHVRVSASIRPWCPFTLCRSCSRTLGLTLRRPSPNASKSVEMEAPASLRQTSSYRLLLRLKRRASATYERPILANVSAGGCFHPRWFMSPRFPCSLVRRAWHAIASSSFEEEAGSESHCTRNTFPATVQNGLRVKCRGPPFFARRVRGDARTPPSVAPRMVETMAMCVCEPTRLEKRTDLPPSQAMPAKGERDGYPPRTSSSTPWSSVCG
jgi:hypothetical protein